MTRLTTSISETQGYITQPEEPGFYLLDSEIVFVKADPHPTGGRYIDRALGGTTAIPHAAGARLTVTEDPGIYPAGGGQTADVQAALDGANAPDAGNVFATMADVGGSQAEILFGLERPRTAVQSVQLAPGIDGGTFALTFDGETTDPLAFDIAPSGLIAALEALATIGADNVRPWQDYYYQAVSLNGLDYYGNNTTRSLAIEFVGSFIGSAVELLALADDSLTGSVPRASEVLDIPVWQAESEFGVAWGNEGESGFDIVSFVRRPSDDSVWASEYGGVGSNKLTGSSQPDWDNPDQPNGGVTDADYVWYPVDASFPTVGVWEAEAAMTPTRLIEAAGYTWASFPNYPGVAGTERPDFEAAVADIEAADYVQDGDGYWWPIGFSAAAITVAQVLQGGPGTRLEPKTYDFSDKIDSQLIFDQSVGAQLVAFESFNPDQFKVGAMAGAVGGTTGFQIYIPNGNWTFEFGTSGPSWLRDGQQVYPFVMPTGVPSTAPDAGALPISMNGSDLYVWNGSAWQGPYQPA